MAKYDELGTTYRKTRVPDPRIQGLVDRALGDAVTVVNVGAGTGSYEPADRAVTAVEPSAVMIAQRAPDAAPCVQASAEALPFPDGSFDAAMAILTVHHWSDLERGVAELRRVAGRIVILTWDAGFGDEFWLTRDYLQASIALDTARFPAIEELAALLGSGRDRRAGTGAARLQRRLLRRVLAPAGGLPRSGRAGRHQQPAAARGPAGRRARAAARRPAQRRLAGAARRPTR